MFTHFVVFTLTVDTQPCTSTTNVFMTNGDAATSSTDVPTSSTVRRFRVNFQQPYEREPSSSLNQFPQRPATSQSLVAKKKTVWSAVSSYFKNPYRPREERTLLIGLKTKHSTALCSMLFFT